MNYKLVLVRHGESEWTSEGRFTGWSDVGLSAKGEAEMRETAALLRTGGLAVAQVWTSGLQRSRRSAEIICQELGIAPPCRSTWRLNERHYGALEGMNKKEASRQYGEEQVRAWRRGFHTRPPPVAPDDPRFHYGVPPGEAPADCLDRVQVWWDQLLAAPPPTPGTALLICAHGTSLRMIIKLLENLADAQVELIELPSGVPIVYDMPERIKTVLIDDAEYEARQQAVRNQSTLN